MTVSTHKTTATGSGQEDIDGGVIANGGNIAGSRFTAKKPSELVSERSDLYGSKVIANTGSAYPSHAWGMTLNLDFDTSKNQAWYHEGTTLYTLESVSGAAWTDRAVTNASGIYMNQCGAYRVA